MRHRLALLCLPLALPRYRADPEALRRFGADANLSGRIGVPVLSVHGVHDPVAFVELDDFFHRTMAQAGQADHLVQTFTDDTEHSYLSDPVYSTLVNALLRWTQTGTKPSAEGIAVECAAHEARFGPGCRFLPSYRPSELESRVTPRQRP